MDSNKGGSDPPQPPSRSATGEDALLSGTDIIFLVNYIISMWLKHSFNTTGKNNIQHFRGDDPPQTNSRGDASPRPPVPPGIAAQAYISQSQKKGSMDKITIIIKVEDLVKDND